jgi:hypothetical protein
MGVGGRRHSPFCRRRDQDCPCARDRQPADCSISDNRSESKHDESTNELGPRSTNRTRSGSTVDDGTNNHEEAHKGTIVVSHGVTHDCDANHFADHLASTNNDALPKSFAYFPTDAE